MHLPSCLTGGLFLISTLLTVPGCGVILDTSGQLNETGKTYTRKFIETENMSTLYKKKGQYYAKVTEAKLTKTVPWGYWITPPLTLTFNDTYYVSKQDPEFRHYYIAVSRDQAKNLPEKKLPLYASQWVFDNPQIPAEQFNEREAKIVKWELSKQGSKYRNDFEKKYHYHDIMLSSKTEVSLGHYLMKPIVYLDFIAVDIPASIVGTVSLGVILPIYWIYSACLPAKQSENYRTYPHQQP